MPWLSRRRSLDATTIPSTGPATSNAMFDRSKENRPLEDVSWAGGVAILEAHQDVQVQDDDDRYDEPNQAATTDSAIVTTV